MTEVQATVQSGEELRTCKIRRALPVGGGSDWEMHIDLRGSPIGDRVLVWEYDRPMNARSASRGVREHVKLMYCAEGWHSGGGTADAPDDPEVCAMIHGPKWRKRGTSEEHFKRFWEFHYEHPVAWIVKTSAPGRLGHRHLAYCDAELPAQYRPSEQAW